MRPILNGAAVVGEMIVLAFCFFSAPLMKILALTPSITPVTKYHVPSAGTTKDFTAVSFAPEVPSELTKKEKPESLELLLRQYSR